MVGDLTPLLASPDTAIAQAKEIRTGLSQLMGKLNVHLSGEDKVLYPKMKGSSNAEAVSAAGRFETEMGGIAAAAKAFSRKWQVPTIQSVPEEFLAEIGDLVATLGARIEQENTVLYPLADQL